MLLYDDGLGEREVKMLPHVPSTCLFASSAMEPVSTDNDMLLLYVGLGDLVTSIFPFSGPFCLIVCTSFNCLVTKTFFPLLMVVETFGGTFSSKFIGKVLDFFIGSIVRLGGAFGGFFGVASRRGGDSGPLEYGDRAPLVVTVPLDLSGI